jgi:hypothetical protein
LWLAFLEGMVFISGLGQYFFGSVRSATNIIIIMDIISAVNNLCVIYFLMLLAGNQSWPELMMVN